MPMTPRPLPTITADDLTASERRVLEVVLTRLDEWLNVLEARIDEALLELDEDDEDPR
jgi:hypothetical protein